MDKKIKIDVFGVWEHVLGNSKKDCSGCGSSGDGIAIKPEGKGCEGCSGCGTDKTAPKTTGEQFEELQTLLQLSQYRDDVELKFYDLNKINVLDYDEIRVLTEIDYEPPFVMIDGIVRYYGGIASGLIFIDIKELME